LLSKLVPGGTIATTFQPRMKNPTRADAIAMADIITAAMANAGFAGIHCEERDFDPPAICVLGSRPGYVRGAAITTLKYRDRWARE
jgi:hypothetical protein